MCSRAPRTATVSCFTDVESYRVCLWEMRQLIKRIPALRKNVLK
jgi:hypothetical protein